MENKDLLRSARTAGGLASPASERPLVVLSQRGPVSFVTGPNGSVEARPGAGGLATALGAAVQSRHLRWIAAAMTPGDRLAASERSTWPWGDAQVQLLTLPERVQELHYGVFANPVLWFLQHGLGEELEPRSEATLREAWEDGYCRANELFANAAVENPGDPVFLVQDYHFYLVPRLIRDRRQDALIGHFLHIPWPHPREWNVLPADMLRDILRGLLACDVVGFQSPADAERFRATCLACLPETQTDGEVLIGDSGHVTTIRSYPITVDAGRLRQLAADPETAAYRSELASSATPTIVRVDRLDPSKNVPAGFQAFGLLLEREPHLRGTVRFIARLVPSRSELPEYRRATEAAFAAAASVNHRFGSPAWQPIELSYEDNLQRGIAALQSYDVLLVNSIADGMNLVAKEGALLNEKEGVIVLSRRTGAWDELGQWALGVDPSDVQGTAEALSQALRMPPAERRQRAEGLRQVVEGASLRDWLDRQLADLGSAWRHRIDSGGLSGSAPP